MSVTADIDLSHELWFLPEWQAIRDEVYKHCADILRERGENDILLAMFEFILGPDFSTIHFNQQRPLRHLLFPPYMTDETRNIEIS